MLNEYYSRSRISNYNSNGTLIVLDYNGEVYEGNYTFFEVWSKLDGKTKIIDIIKEFQETFYETDPREIEQDVIDIIATMKNMSIINQDHSFVPSINNTDTRLLSVHFAITSSCNLHCQHCYLNNIKPKFVPFEKYEVILKDLANIGILSLEISGGEPIVHNNFIEIIKLAKLYGFYVKLFTNATLINITNITEIKRYVDCYRISLDGIEESHDYRRGCGTFRRTLKALELLKGADVQVSMTIDDINYKDIDKVHKIVCEDLHFKFEVSPVVPYSHIQFTHDKLRLVQKKINESILKRNTTTRANIRGVNCNAAIGQLYINSELMVTPCPLLYQEKWHIGNLTNHSIRELLDSLTYTKIVQSLKAIKSNCSRCDKCQFWCAAIVDQTKDKISPLCIQNK